MCQAAKMQDLPSAKCLMSLVWFCASAREVLEVSSCNKMDFTFHHLKSPTQQFPPASFFPQTCFGFLGCFGIILK